MGVKWLILKLKNCQIQVRLLLKMAIKTCSIVLMLALILNAEAKSLENEHQSNFKPHDIMIPSCNSHSGLINGKDKG